jgi:hypothetical protein
MAFAVRLFRIKLYNTYYKDKVCNDFQLIPNNVTQKWMERYNMRLVASPGCFEVFWLTARLTDPLQLLQEKMLEIKLSFHLLLKNPNIISYSALSIEQGKTYYFSNTRANARLHQKEYVTELDTIPIQELAIYPSQLEKAYFGIVDLYLKELCKAPNFSEGKVPIDYAIYIKAKETT